MKFQITQHCRDRYVERVNKTPNSLVDIVKLVNEATDVTNKIFDSAPRFILYLYTKYKSANIKILFKDSVYYIATRRKNTDDLFDVMTCYKGDERFKMYANSVMKRSEIIKQIESIALTMDIGIDVAFKLFGEYRPFNFLEIEQILKEKTSNYLNHH